MNGFDKVTIELQWVAWYLQWVATQATCSLAFTMYKYNGMQMSYTIQKLNYKASYKTPFFFIVEKS
jgi:hypothetical protein